MPEAFNLQEWEDRYGEGAEDMEHVFEYGIAILDDFPQARMRMDAVLELDDQDPVKIREYIVSLYEQCEQGTVLFSDEELRSAEGNNFIVHDDGSANPSARFNRVIESVSKPFDWQGEEPDKQPQEKVGSKVFSAIGRCVYYVQLRFFLGLRFK